MLLACICILGIFRTAAQVNTMTGALLYSTDEGLLISDTIAFFSIKEIHIQGNRQTKEFIILRELPFKAGEAYALNTLVDKFQATRQQLMNTGLFRSVVVSLKSLKGFDVYVSIEVKERWYIYPIPHVKIVDRNINEWVVKRNMDLNRVNYGIKLTHRNLTGRNDKLYVSLVNGFTKQVVFRYDGLYLDKSLKWSSNFNVAYGKVHEVVYNTINDKQVAYRNEDKYIHTFLRTRLEFSYRRAIKTRHTFGIGYNVEKVADTLYQLNPFFAGQKDLIRYPELSYRMAHYNVDAIPYPRNGYIAEIGLTRKGLGGPVNLWQLSAMGSAFWPLNNKYTFNLRLAGMVKAPFRQDYINKQFLGYNNLFMQGYEYNVIDGVAGGYGKGILSRQIINSAIHIPSKKFERLNSIAFAVYAKVYGNAGYVYDKYPGENLLSNRLLYSGGVGIDVVLFNDLVIKLDWSTNQFGQNGIYLHQRDYF